MHPNNFGYINIGIWQLEFKDVNHKRTETIYLASISFALF